MTEQNVDLTLGEFLIILTFALGFGLFLGWLIWGIDKPQYDSDCLDELANKICIEEGYSLSDWRNERFFSCKVDERYAETMSMKWLEGEKEQCLI